MSVYPAEYRIEWGQRKWRETPHSNHPGDISKRRSKDPHPSFLPLTFYILSKTTSQQHNPRLNKQTCRTPMTVCRPSVLYDSPLSCRLNQPAILFGKVFR